MDEIFRHPVIGIQPVLGIRPEALDDVDMIASEPLALLFADDDMVARHAVVKRAPSGSRSG